MIRICSGTLKSHRLLIIIILLAALITRIPHVISFISSSSDIQLTYFPTLGAARFEECARSLTDGSPSGDAFAFASPLYILLLAPLYALGITNTTIFILQTCVGIATILLIYFIALKGGASKGLAATGAILWSLYAPPVFYEMTLLPVTLLCFLVSLWVMGQFTKKTCKRSSLATGLLSGVITGLRPPFIVLGLVSLWQEIRKKNYIYASFVLIGFLIPMLVLSAYHSSQGGGFTPFAASVGVNLVQGHADGATGYGPPIVEYGLIEGPFENIHQVGARVAAENGYLTKAEANKFWLEKSLKWIVSNPGGEFRLLRAKLGAFFGRSPYDSYFDLPRDIGSDSSLNHLIVPRYLLMIFLITGVVSFLVYRREEWSLAIPLFTALLSILAFTHSERYFILALPAALAVACSGLEIFFQNIGTPERKKTLTAVLLTFAIVLTGKPWQVAEVPYGQYLFNRGAKAYNMRNYLLALTLFEESAEASPPGSSTFINAESEALRISQAYNFDDRILLHTESLDSSTD